MNKYSEHYWKLQMYKQNFENMLSKLPLIENEEDRLNFAIYITKFFVYKNSGYYTSSVLEKFFLGCGKNIKVDLTGIQYKKDSTLHVMTRGYETGGHTRVVERWIQNAPSNQVHSVVLINPGRAKLNVLQDAVIQKNGKYILFDNDLSVKEKAISLRKLAMEYEYVVLHTHMDDPIATIAFGTEDFTRPVLFYNHASHMPWLGKSIADLVLDIENNDPVTKEKRGIENAYFIGVPSKEISLTVADKEEVRELLHLPLDKKIIVSSGGDARYRTISGNGFIDHVKKIIDENTYCYVIGINKKNKIWKKAFKDTKGHIIPLEFINFNEGFINYLKAADLYIDSYPLGGGTATIDAISSGTPVLSLESVYPQFDYLIRTSAYCKMEEELIDKAKKVLDDEHYAEAIFEELKNSLMEYQSISAWNKKVKKLYETAPKQHKVKSLSNIPDYSEPNDLSVLCNTTVDDKFLTLKKIKLLSEEDINEIIEFGDLYKKQGIPFIFQILSYKKADKKTRLLKIFCFEVVKWKIK